MTEFAHLSANPGAARGKPPARASALGDAPGVAEARRAAPAGGFRHALAHAVSASHPATAPVAKPSLGEAAATPLHLPATSSSSSGLAAGKNAPPGGGALPAKAAPESIKQASVKLALVKPASAAPGLVTPTSTEVNPAEANPAASQAAEDDTAASSPPPPADIAPSPAMLALAGMQAPTALATSPASGLTPGTPAGLAVQASAGATPASAANKPASAPASPAPAPSPAEAHAQATPAVTARVMVTPKATPNGAPSVVISLDETASSPPPPSAPGTQGTAGVSPAASTNPINPALTPAAASQPADCHAAAKSDDGADSDDSPETPAPDGAASDGIASDSAATLPSPGGAMLAASGPVAATPASTLAASPAPAHHVATLVDRLVAARNDADDAGQSVQTSVTHSQFGQVSLHFAQDGAGLKVSMASNDPAFAPAARAALASGAVHSPTLSTGALAAGFAGGDAAASSDRPPGGEGAPAHHAAQAASQASAGPSGGGQAGSGQAGSGQTGAGNAGTSAGALRRSGANRDASAPPDGIDATIPSPPPGRSGAIFA